MRPIRILGGGPAGAAAALAALKEGSGVEIYEQSAFPRHRVCGEFLSPEVARSLDHLGVWNEFKASQPAAIRAMKLHFRSSEKTAKLSEPAYGLSRYTLDRLLLEKAAALGARVHRERGECLGPTVLAFGRTMAGRRGSRTFGFKAHFAGPIDDAVELFFLARGVYVGVSQTDGGFTNVCGLAPESVLATHGFAIDELMDLDRALSRRLRPLRRVMDWLITGPLVYAHQLRETTAEDVYRAGDALSFIDPFTGSGILSAIVTGGLAGIAAARGASASDYRAQCRRVLARPFAVSSLFRGILARGWADRLAQFVPSRLLFLATRPRI